MTHSVTLELPNSRRKWLGLLTISDMAERVGIDRQTFYRHIRRGECPAPYVRLAGGKARYYREADFPEVKGYWNEFLRST